MRSAHRPLLNVLAESKSCGNTPQQLSEKQHTSCGGGRDALE